MSRNTHKIKNRIMNKHAELTLSVIVMAALALIFLVIMIAVFTGKISLFSKDLSACETKNGICLTETEVCDGQKTSFTCSDLAGQKRTCCIQGCELAGGTCQEKVSGEHAPCGETKKSLDYSCTGEKVCCS